MRTYLRLPVTVNGVTSLEWTEFQTLPNGDNGLVWLATLVRCLQLRLGESLNYPALGIPVRQTLMNQVWPDYYVQQIQQYFAPNFLALTISRVAGATQPTYNVYCLLLSGQLFVGSVSNQTQSVLGTQSGLAITTTSGQEIIIT